jgi:hypothetical protein
VVAVADAFDAMTTDRPYRRALPPGEAFADIERQAGAQFAPDCAPAWLGLWPRVEELLDQGAVASGRPPGKSWPARWRTCTSQEPWLPADVRKDLGHGAVSRPTLD